MDGIGQVERRLEPSQVSFQNRVCIPFLTSFTIPCCSLGSVFRILFHTFDMFVFGRQVEQLVEFTAYFDLMTWVYKQSSSWIKRQPSLAKNALFIDSRLHNPRPPRALLLVTMSQLTIWHFLLFSDELPHKKLRMSFSIVLITPLGSNVICMV